MTRAMLSLNVQPYRMLKKSGAAAYCGLSVSGFEQNCAVRPVTYPDGRTLWDVRDLDAWLDRLKSDQNSTDDEILNRLGG